jgi:uncharacterized protein (TIGR01777 family)
MKTENDNRSAPHEVTKSVLVSGAGGMIGSALLPFLQSLGHRVLRLVRRTPPPQLGEIFWDPTARELDPAPLEGIDAVVHLAGENIAGGRWYSKRKRLIRDSRVEGTRLLSETLARLDRPPKVMVCASAIGFYGDRGDERLTETSSPGHGFLTEVCREWEAVADPARDAGIRVVHLRLGMVLDPAGGGLAELLLLYRWGLGGPVGDGRQYVSWISIVDAVGAIHQAMVDPALVGPVNGVAPESLPQREFAQTLARVLHRPAFFPLPAPVARLLLGEMAKELILSSARVIPERLLAAGYVFRHAQLEGALRDLLDWPKNIAEPRK